MKKAKLIILIITAVILTDLAGALILYSFKYKKTLISETSNGTYTVKVYTVGDPDFPYGASHCRIVLKKGAKTISAAKADVYNDGGAALEENFSCEWKDTYVSVSVSSEEHETVEYDLYY